MGLRELVDDELRARREQPCRWCGEPTERRCCVTIRDGDAVLPVRLALCSAECSSRHLYEVARLGVGVEFRA